MSENGEIYTAGKNFTLPPAVTALTNLTSVLIVIIVAAILALADTKGNHFSSFFLWKPFALCDQD